MKQFVIAYLAIGMLLCGCVIGDRRNRCPLEEQKIGMDLPILVAMWPVAVVAGFVVRRDIPQAVCKPPVTP